MKKILVTLLNVFLLMTATRQVAAKSGCCSGHGGVSCGAGAQADGTVICNDGWRGSSCSYTGMVMCGQVGTPAVVKSLTTPIREEVAPVEKKRVVTTLTTEQLQKRRCDTTTAQIMTKIKTQEKKKETQLIALQKTLGLLETKIKNGQEKELDTTQLTERVASFSKGITDYQAAYDQYTNALYQVSHYVCNDDKAKLLELQQQAAGLATPLTKQYSSLLKMAAQAKGLKLIK